MSAELSIDLGCFASFIDACRAGGHRLDEDERSTPRMAASGKQARDEWSGDLTGRHISHFTVLSQSTATQGGRRLCICECECDCGAIFTRRACEIRYAARHGRAQYCARNCPVRLAELAPIMVGDRIGHLTVTTAPFVTGHERRCECRCDCGAQVVRQVRYLREAARRRLASRCSPNCPSRWEHVTSSDLDAPRTTHNASDLIGRHNDTREEA